MKMNNEFKEKFSKIFVNEELVSEFQGRHIPVLQEIILHQSKTNSDVLILELASHQNDRHYHPVSKSEFVRWLNKVQRHFRDALDFD